MTTERQLTVSHTHQPRRPRRYTSVSRRPRAVPPLQRPVAGRGGFPDRLEGACPGGGGAARGYASLSGDVAAGVRGGIVREQKRRVGSMYRPGWERFERPMPLLQLAGPWLGEAGFAPGDEVRVVVRQGRLLVVRRDLDPEWLGRRRRRGGIAVGRVPQAEIDRIKREADLAAQVRRCGVELKRHGKDLIGLCPFHDDRAPSLVVTPQKNLWNCLGACGEGGSVIDWVMKIEGISFRQAVELLRKGWAPSERARHGRPGGGEVDPDGAAGAGGDARRGDDAGGGGALPRDAAGEPGGAGLPGPAGSRLEGADRALPASASLTARWATGCRSGRRRVARRCVTGCKSWG